MRRTAALLGFVFSLLRPAASHAIVGWDALRSLGMGGGMRAAAVGDVAPLLNPSGMALLRIYSIEAGYQFGVQDSAHAAHAALVDSTSGFNLAGGLTYTFIHASPDGQPTRNGHEARLALAFPFGDKVFIGATGSYLYLTEPESKKGITVDVGLTLRPIPVLSAAVVGYNLRDIDMPEAPRAIGYGLAFAPNINILFALDGVTRLATEAPGDKAGTSVTGGGEVLFAKRIAVRAGGGYDGIRERGHAAAGLSLISEEGALDIAFSQEVTGSDKLTVLAAGFRLFVPQI